MGRPGMTSSDILGIEIGRSVVRGVRLDQETTIVTAGAECRFEPSGSADGIIDPATVGPALDELLDLLGVHDRPQARVGFTVGPRNAGVGSGPSMTSWLEAQAQNLQEPMMCSGGLGIAFVPSRAIDAAVKLALGTELDLVRIDLAPVAAARAIGDQVEDLICVGSGRGWKARMRDFEVLEAMESPEVGFDDSLSIVGVGGPRPVIGYGWVEIDPELRQAPGFDSGQLAAAVGVAIGVAYESPANLLVGSEVMCGPAVGQMGPAPMSVPRPIRAATARAASNISDPSDTPEAVADMSSIAVEELAPVSETTLRLGPEAVEELGRTIEAEASEPQAAASGTIAPARVDQRDPWGGTIDESDPITMFSPDTEVRHMLGKRDSRLSVDVLLVLLAVAAVGLLLAYLYV